MPRLCLSTWVHSSTAAAFWILAKLPADTSLRSMVDGALLWFYSIAHASSARPSCRALSRFFLLLEGFFFFFFYLLVALEELGGCLGRLVGLFGAFWGLFVP